MLFRSPFYIRISDIPAPWDAQFSRAIRGSNCPGFPDEGPCAHGHDWESWVHGRWWGGTDAPSGLEPGQHQIDYVCNAVKAVYNVSPPGLSDIVVVALKCRGKLTPEECELYGRLVGHHVLDVVERCSAAAHQVARGR